MPNKFSNAEYKQMVLVKSQDYKKFVRTKQHVTIDKIKVPLGSNLKISCYAPSQQYNVEGTTVWSFPDRGDWATHSGKYRGNFSPFVPRNLILKYTEEGDLVLDQMTGGGTTLVECKLLQRNAIGIDVNSDAIMVTRDRLNFDCQSIEDYNEPKIQTYVGDARNLNKIKDEKIDLIITHPPYARIISYTERRLNDDISSLRKVDDYLLAMKKIAEESFRVLKEDKYCSVVIGDTRKHRHYVPIAFRVLQEFLNVGFRLKEDIIKIQHNVLTNRGRWRGSYYDFYKIMHEHVFVFRKAKEREVPMKLSRKWW